MDKNGFIVFVPGGCSFLRRHRDHQTLPMLFPSEHWRGLHELSK